MPSCIAKFPPRGEEYIRALYKVSNYHNKVAGTVVRVVVRRVRVVHVRQTVVRVRVVVPRARKHDGVARVMIDGSFAPIFPIYEIH